MISEFQNIHRWALPDKLKWKKVLFIGNLSSEFLYVVFGSTTLLFFFHVLQCLLAFYFDKGFFSWLFLLGCRTWGMRGGRAKWGGESLIAESLCLVADWRLGSKTGTSRTPAFIGKRKCVPKTNCGLNWAFLFEPIALWKVNNWYVESARKCLGKKIFLFCKWPFLYLHRFPSSWKGFLHLFLVPKARWKVPRAFGIRSRRHLQSQPLWPSWDWMARAGWASHKTWCLGCLGP